MLERRAAGYRLRVSLRNSLSFIPIVRTYERALGATRVKSSPSSQSKEARITTQRPPLMTAIELNESFTASSESERIELPPESRLADRSSGRRRTRSVKLDPRRLMEQAIQVMRRSISEPRVDRKVGPLVGQTIRCSRCLRHSPPSIPSFWRDRAWKNNPGSESRQISRQNGGIPPPTFVR
jgi:hypothetical protein